MDLTWELGGHPARGGWLTWVALVGGGQRLKEFVMKPHQRQLEAEPGRRAEAMFE